MKIKIILFFLLWAGVLFAQEQKPAFWDDIQAFKKQDSFRFHQRMLFFLLVVLHLPCGRMYRTIFPVIKLSTGVLAVLPWLIKYDM